MTDEEKNAKVLASRMRKRDIKEIGRLVLSSPFQSGKTIEVDGNIGWQDLAKSNTDVATRIMVRMAGEAINGDVKAAEFVMKYSGYEPPKETNINVNIPTFIDDIKKVEGMTEAKKISNDKDEAIECEVISVENKK